VSWWLAVLWLVSGIVIGAVGIVYAMAYVLKNDTSLQREWFRTLAKHFPESLEAALRHEHVMHPPHDTFPEITFGTCDICHLPYPLEADHLIRHSRFDAKGNDLGKCPGSGTDGYDL